MTFKEIVDAVATLGALGFALVGIYTFFSGKLHSDSELLARLADKDKVIADRDVTIAYERDQKEKSFALVDRLQASHDQLTAAVEARNDLDRERLRTGR